MEPKEWTWERFTVVDAGNGEIALHNTWHNRFVRMNTDGMDASAVKVPRPEKCEVVSKGDMRVLWGPCVIGVMVLD